jgi:hypothetical protein
VFNGFLVEQVGPEHALMISSGLMLTVMVVLGLTTSLWRFDAKEQVP